MDKSKKYGGLLVNNFADHQDTFIQLARKGSSEDLKGLLEHPRLMFWGDLDREGMCIYMSLKKSFSQVKLSGLYQPMMDHLKNGNAHPYSKGADKEGQRIFKNDDQLLNCILDACKNTAVDQEIVTGDQIMRYAGVPMNFWVG